MTTSKDLPKKSATGTHSYTHTDFTYVRKKRGAKVEEEEMGELNIVPYLDIIVNLIMFLLVIQATLVSLGLIDVTAPSYAALGPAGGSDEQQAKALRLTIGVAREGFFIAARGGVLPGADDSGTGEQAEGGVERRKPTIPVLENGNHNFPALKKRLREIKDWVALEHPEMKTDAAYVAADPDTPYQVVVHTLDASRDDATGILFPQVAFTQIR